VFLKKTANVVFFFLLVQRPAIGCWHCKVVYSLRASPAVALYLRAVKRRTSAPYPHAARGAREHFAGSSKTALDNAARKQHFTSRCILARARPAQTTIQHMHTSNWIKQTPKIEQKMSKKNYYTKFYINNSIDSFTTHQERVYYNNTIKPFTNKYNK
jgi:hypothetical protein